MDDQARVQDDDIQPAWSDAEGAARAIALFTETFGETPDGVWASPGRVNLIGEHVDYNAGPCMPIALPHRTFAAVRRRDDDVVRMVTSLADEPWVGTLADIAPGQVSSWVAYAGGPAWVLTQEGYALGGFDVALESCVPLGAGLSSSAAVECAVALGLDELFDINLAQQGDEGRAQLAAICVRAENDVAGAPTGGLDQAASLRAQPGYALLLDTLDHSVTQVPFPLAEHGLVLLVIDTRAEHSLVDGQYAARREACHAAAANLGVDTLREVTDLPSALAALDDEEQQRRVRHVVSEIGRVGQFAYLVREGRVLEVGPLMNASHESLRDDYEVSCDELDVAVAVALEAGALGARMTGGGFGGSAIALVEADAVPAVAQAVRDAYAERGWTPPEFLIAEPATGGARVSEAQA